jgi:hypothetical protein
LTLAVSALNDAELLTVKASTGPTGAEKRISGKSLIYVAFRQFESDVKMSDTRSSLLEHVDAEGSS